MVLINIYNQYNKMAEYTLFNSLLLLGQQFEDKAQQQIINYYKSKNKDLQILNICSSSKYDFQLSNLDKYEVKYDRIAVKTNNIFVEVMQFNKNSGLLLSEAKYYIFIINNLNIFGAKFLFYRIKTKKLKKLIKNNIYHSTYQDKDKAGYLFSIETIKANSKQI
jgi:hypothetical protein